MSDEQVYDNVMIKFTPISEPSTHVTLFPHFYSLQLARVQPTTSSRFAQFPLDKRDSGQPISATGTHQSESTLSLHSTGRRNWRKTKIRLSKRLSQLSERLSFSTVVMRANANHHDNRPDVAHEACHQQQQQQQQQRESSWRRPTSFK